MFIKLSLIMFNDNLRLKFKNITKSIYRGWHGKRSTTHERHVTALPDTWHTSVNSQLTQTPPSTKKTKISLFYPRTDPDINERTRLVDPVWSALVLSTKHEDDEKSENGEGEDLCILHRCRRLDLRRLRRKRRRRKRSGAHRGQLRRGGRPGPRRPCRVLRAMVGNRISQFLDSFLDF